MITRFRIALLSILCCLSSSRGLGAQANDRPTGTLSIVPTAEVAGSPSPEGVAISADSRWAFVTLQGRNRVITIDLIRGTIIGWAPTGTWSDGIAYSVRSPKI